MVDALCYSICFILIEVKNVELSILHHKYKVGVSASVIDPLNARVISFWIVMV